MERCAAKCICAEMVGGAVGVDQTKIKRAAMHGDIIVVYDSRGVELGSLEAAPNSKVRKLLEADSCSNISESLGGNVLDVAEPQQQGGQVVKFVLPAKKTSARR